MDSKVDKQIHRYLKRISSNYSQAVSYDSRYYTIDYGDGIVAKIRFSDHLSPDVNKCTMDIIKMNSDTYIIGIKAMRYSATSDRVLQQLKSLMIIVPELARFATRQTAAVDNLTKKMTKLGKEVAKEKKALRKQYSEAEGLIELYDEIDNKHKKATEEIARLTQVITTKDKVIEKLLKRVEILEMHNNAVVNLIDKIKNTTDQAKREIALANNLIKNE